MWKNLSCHRAAGAALLTTLWLLTVSSAQAMQSALSGRIVGPDQQPMEGVVVIARPADANWLVSATSDAGGVYRFPAQRLPAGDYSLSVRATGFALNGETPSVKIGAEPTAADLALMKVESRDALAAQLTWLDWLRSWPGPDAEKSAMMHNLVNCMFCHSLERIARSPYDADGFLQVMQRMLTYETDHSSDMRIQRVAPPLALEGLSWFGTDARRIATYLASINRPAGSTDWDYNFKPLPRPVGDGTRAVVTVFPIPRANSVIHDLDVDADGNVWYGNTGWDYLGKLDPRSATFSEWEAPNFLPAEPAPGTDRIVGVQDIQVDGNGHVWAATGGTRLARFIPATAKWQVFDMPVVWRNPFLSPVRKGETGLWATGLAGPADDLRETAYRLDINSGQLSAGIDLFGHMPPPDDPFHNDATNYCYMMDQDQNGDFLCTAPVPSGIIRADLRSGKSRFYPTPTPHAYPRRGYRDSQNRFWFSEFYADKIGVIDLDTNEIREYDTGIDFISPYYARPDEKGYVWASSTGSDRLLRLNIDSGELTQYLMPVSYDARKVVVDLNAAHSTIWLPSKNAAELIRVEIFD